MLVCIPVSPLLVLWVKVTHVKGQHFHFWRSFLCGRAESPPFAEDGLECSSRAEQISVGGWCQGRLG